MAGIGLRWIVVVLGCISVMCIICRLLLINATDSGICVFFIQSDMRYGVGYTNSMPDDHGSFVRFIRPCRCDAGLSATSALIMCPDILISVIFIDFLSFARSHLDSKISAFIENTRPQSFVGVIDSLNMMMESSTGMIT